MAKSEVRWRKLGDFIEARNERNTDLQWGKDLIVGVNNSGRFQRTKANTSDIDMKPYKAVYHGDFVYNPSRLNIGSFAYREDDFCIVSHLYVVFYITEENKTSLLPEYLLIFCQRKEFLRMVDYHNFGSQRAEFNIHDISDFEIPIPYTDGKPDTKRQQEIVDVWQGLRTMKEQNEQQAEPLFQLCRSYMEHLKKDYDFVEIGQYIEPVDERNTSNLELSVYGINKTKTFMPTVADMEGVDTSKYNIVKYYDFAFSGMQTGRDECIRVALHTEKNMILVSPAYITFRIKEEKKERIIPEYILLSFKRPEMDRYGWFISDSSVRANLDWPRFLAIRIPLPPIDVQRAIVNIYHCAEEAKRIAEEADRLSREICPALMQHIIHEAEGGRLKDAEESVLK